MNEPREVVAIDIGEMLKRHHNEMAALSERADSTGEQALSLMGEHVREMRQAIIMLASNLSRDRVVFLAREDSEGETNMTVGNVRNGDEGRVLLEAVAQLVFHASSKLAALSCGHQGCAFHLIARRVVELMPAEEIARYIDAALAASETSSGGGEPGPTRH